MRGYQRSNPGQGFGGPRYPGTFLLALREAFSRQSWQANRWLGDAVDCTDANGREQVLALENLYRRVKQADRATWPELLVEFLAQVPDEALADPPASLAEVAHRLLVRLGPPFSSADTSLTIWSQPLAGDQVVVTLVVDYPTSMSYVTRDMIGDSGQDGAFWLTRALANLREQTPEGCLTEVHAESGLLQIELGDAYDSSRALLLDDLLPAHRENGFFVAVPGRDHLLVLPVSAPSLPFLAWLRMLAIRTHRNVPYPISPEVFWVCEGAWRHFPIDMQGEQALVNPPPEFIAVLARIAPNLPEEDFGELDGGSV